MTWFWLVVVGLAAGFLLTVFLSMFVAAGNADAEIERYLFERERDESRQRRERLNVVPCDPDLWFDKDWVD